ncbi:DUF6691 family protein [Ruegeria sp. Ofav3-42]|uniref:DUF6691 family protein n=1 Tax=Ruegeria sp. Ofav3-42 TaxID=2917759 RepID=UPI001EF4320B|nr:DUF6691 family protein [Ruegeria sp. Ofav3-42]MCG7519967.1 YeeE/YedE family protein [Ruegeria sp. Ofav3-42]
MKLIVTYLIGLIFGVGISVSGMVNPAKVLNFFDLAGTWDPSLIFVMGGALVTTFFGYILVFGRAAPLYANNFSLPTSRDIDTKLVGGAALFGVGWGLSGFCPGGAIPALGTGNWHVFAFLAALIAGIFLAKFIQSVAAGRARAKI